MATTSMVLVNGSTATSALADPVPATSFPTTAYLAVPKGAKSVMLYLGGYHDTTPADNDYAYQVVVWRAAPDPTDEASATQLATPQLVAKGVATLGTLVMQDASGDADYLYADTITNTLTARPDVLVFSPADNTMGWIYIEFDDAVGIELESDLDGGSGTAVTSVYAFARFSEEVHPFFLNRLIGGVNATTTDSLHGKIGTDTEMGDASLYDMLTTLTTNLATVSGYTLYDGWRVVSKTITANPGTTPGTVLFTLSASQALKVVELQIFAVVGEAITDTAAETLTIKTEAGTTLIAATTATALVAGELWHDASPDASVELSSVAPTYLFACPFTNNTILLEQSGATAWGAGSLTIYCRWRPIHAAGTLTAS